MNDDLVIKKVDNAIFCPRGFASSTHDVVYDQEGELVSESTVPRGDDESPRITEATGAPSRIDRSTARGAVLDDELLFLGTLDVKHFGRWLTEGISRLWPLLHAGESQRIVWATSLNARLRRIRNSRFLAGAGANHWRHSLPAFNIGQEALRSISRPARIKTLFVPEPSMKIRSPVHPNHLAVAQKIGLHVIGDRRVERSEQPVFYSRTRLKSSNRKIKGEDRIEEFCRKKGALIVYPEKLSLAEQIAIVERHDLFIGGFGSAWHALLFRNSRRPLKCIYLIPEFNDDFPRTWDFIDAAMGNEVEKILCCFREGGGKKSKYFDYSIATESLDKNL